MKTNLLGSNYGELQSCTYGEEAGTVVRLTESFPLGRTSQQGKYHQVTALETPT